MKIIAYNIRRIVILNDAGIIFIIEDFYRAYAAAKTKYMPKALLRVDKKTGTLLLV